jgi:hypothetical protein
MKEFINDYKDLCKQSIGFCKKHWKGMLVVTAVTTAVEAALIAYQLKKNDDAVREYLREENEVQK